MSLIQIWINPAATNQIKPAIQLQFWNITYLPALLEICRLFDFRNWFWFHSINSIQIKLKTFSLFVEFEWINQKSIIAESNQTRQINNSIRAALIHQSNFWFLKLNCSLIEEIEPEFDDWINCLRADWNSLGLAG